MEDVLHIVVANADAKAGLRRTLLDRVCTGYVQQGSPDLPTISMLAQRDGKHIILGA